MSTNINSVLTIIRPSTSKDQNIILEVMDPENGLVDSYAKEELSDFTKINNILNDIKLRLRHEDAEDSGYAQWLQKGWNKSLDYYLASRSTPIDKQTDFKSHVLSNGNKNSFNTDKQHSVPQALISRRTKRVFNKKSLEKAIFFSGIENAFTHISDDIRGFKLYLIVYNIEEIAPAVYSYDYENKSLILIREGLFSEEMSANIQGMDTPRSACFSIILVADFDNLMRLRPGQKGLRATYIEAGRLAQKLVISYIQYGVFSLVTPALRDRAVSELLKLKEPDFAPLYSLTFGYPLK